MGDITLGNSKARGNPMGDVTLASGFFTTYRRLTGRLSKQCNLNELFHIARFCGSKSDVG